MSKYIILLLIVALAAAANSGRRVNVNTKAAENNIKWWTESKATTYTSKSFDANVGKDKYIIIQFCATFSKDCEALAPEYNKLAEMYTGSSPKHADVIVSKIDGWTFTSLSQTYNVKKFPTIRFFNKGDPTNSDEYNGDLTADKLSEWMENLIKAKSGQGTEQKKPEEAKQQDAEPPKQEEKQPEPVNTQNTDNQAANTQATSTEATNTQAVDAQAKQPEAAKPADAEDLKKEYKLVLNTTLLQAQFDEVQKQLNTLKENLEKSIVENFKKVETLTQTVEGHKSEFRTLADSLNKHGDKISQLGSTLSTHKDDIKGHFTNEAQGHFTGLKDSVNSIKNKVFEKKIEEPTGPGFMHNLIYMVIGGAVGGVAVHFLGKSGARKRAYLD